MSKQTRWLFSEIHRWEQAAIITPEQAARLRALYPEPAGGAPWGMIVFSGIGAVVVGLGVILLIAYNWSEIPKFGKLGLILGSTAVAHAGGVWLRERTVANRALADTLSLLGTLLFGAGIWLVAQVYNINEHFPNGFLIWGLGALALAWALESVPQGILAAVTLTIWGCSEAVAYDSPIDLSSALVIASLAPLAWRRRSVVLAAVIVAAIYVLLLVNAAHRGGVAAVFTNALSLSVLLIAIARLVRDQPNAGGLMRVLGAYGFTGFLLCSYSLSFDDAVHSALRWDRVEHADAWVRWLYQWLMFAVAGAAWLWLALRHAIRDRSLLRLEDWLCPIALIYCQGLAVSGYYGDAWFVALVFNLVCLGVAAMWMVRGCRDGRLGVVVAGSLLLSAIVLARYFDLFTSLALRGLAFLLLGGLLFAEGFYYRRLRQAGDDEGRRP